jgi:uncharacterized protein (DUF362 family)/Pyruvate/2-oxoacid:ferredoxin oxidoreductase delta subunit
MHRVMIHPASYDRLAEAIERAFEMFPLAIAGKKVLLKPNVLRASRAEEGIVTNPAVLAAVIKKVASYGPASLVVGDNPGVFSYGANEEGFISSGLMAAAGPYYRNIGTDSCSVPFNKFGHETLSVSKAVLDADIVISLPKFKTHGLTVVSGAIKNSYGILPGAQKARLHGAAGSPERFHELLVEVFRLRVPDLFIVDGVVGMEGNGPASTDLRDIGVLLASDNAVALDAVIATMMGCNPGSLAFLRKAREYGLGDFNPGSIEVSGEMKTLAGFKLPPLGGGAIHDNQALMEFVHKKTLLRPKADQLLCTGCAQCVEHCPVSALVMKGHVPEVVDGKCITCFCCQEICPAKAIALN